MESPMNSSIQNEDNYNPTHGSEDVDRGDDLSEESGWTAYLEDFPSSDNASCFTSSPSLVSDAAWYGPDGYARIKRLSFKSSNNNNNRTKYSCEQDLEDTASSPKVSTMEHMQVNYPRIDGAATDNFLGNVAGSTTFSELVETKKNNGKNVFDQKKYVDLRERGLCVVPMSAVVNYFG